MSTPQTRRLTAEIRAIDEKATRVTALVSTRSVDRHATIFLPEAFTRTLPVYLAQNPMFLWGHLWHGPPTAALGIAVDGRVVPGEGLELTFEYAVAENPVAKMVWDLVVKRVIRAFSIGAYIITEVTPRSAKTELEALPDYARQALASGECEAVYTEVELVEVSQVLLGSNRDALVKALDDGVVPREFALRALAGQQLEHVIEEIVRSAAALDTSRLAVRQNGGASMAKEVTMKLAADTTEAVSAIGDLTKALSLVRSLPAPNSRMPVEAIDNANRLETAAMCLRAMQWYDDDDEDKMETCQGVLKILAEVAAFVESVMPTSSSGEEPAATTSAAPQTREGKTISAANAEKLRSARGKCMEAVGHLDELLGDGEEGDNCGDGEQPEAAAAPDKQTLELARVLADLGAALKD